MAKKKRKKKDSGNRRPTVLVTLQQGEEEYGPPYTTLRDLVIRGYLPRVQLGNSKRIWVKREDVERLIEEGTTDGLR